MKCTGLTGLIVAALAVAACLRSSPEVVVYTSEDQVFSEPVLKDFEKTTGIKVRAVYDTEETKSTGVALRIVAERDRPQADVFWANEPLRAVMLQQQGLLESYRSPSADDIPSRYRDPDGHWTGFAARARVIVYNTNEVKAGEAPSSVRDLVDPRWKGRAGLANPLFGTTTTQVAALVALWASRPRRSSSTESRPMVSSSSRATERRKTSSSQASWRGRSRTRTTLARQSSNTNPSRSCIPTSPASARS